MCSLEARAQRPIESILLGYSLSTFVEAVSSRAPNTLSHSHDTTKLQVLTDMALAGPNLRQPVTITAHHWLLENLPQPNYHVSTSKSTCR